MFHWILNKLILRKSEPYIAIMKMVNTCDGSNIIRQHFSSGERSAYKCGDLKVERERLDHYTSIYEVKLPNIDLSYTSLTDTEIKAIFWALVEKYNKHQIAIEEAKLKDYLKQRKEVKDVG